MKTNDVVVLAGLAVGAVLLMNRAGAAKGMLPAGSKSTQPATVNLQGDVWQKLLGNGWSMLADATRADGGPEFLVRNWLGQTTTTDGKPISEQYMELAPTTYGLELPVDTSYNGTDYESQLFTFGRYF